MMRKSRCVMCMLAMVAFVASVDFPSIAAAQSVTLFSENFEGLDLGPNVDEGLNDPDVRDAVFSPNGPPGWTIDRTGVPGYGTAADGVTEFAGWNFLDPIWWAETSGQQRDLFATDPGVGLVVAVADSDEWDDAGHPPGTFNYVHEHPCHSGCRTAVQYALGVLSAAGGPKATQTATITASFDGGAPVEILRYESNTESEFYWPDANPEHVSVPLGIPAGAKNGRTYVWLHPGQ